MERMRRRWSSQEQKAELWERWKNGQSPSDIAHALERKTKGGEPGNWHIVRPRAARDG
jgi:hypothetical protein